MKRAAWWSLELLLGILVLLDVVIVIAGIVDIADHDYGVGAGQGSIVLLLLVGAGQVYAARSVRRHRRRHDPRQGVSQPARSYSSPGDGSYRSVFFVIVIGGVAVFVSSWLAQSWPTWRTSVETQTHGLASTLTVDRVIRIAYRTRGGEYHTAQLQGELVPPIDGYSETTVYTPSGDAFSEREKIPVLVDPQNLAYAEQPGLENYSGIGIVGIVGVMVVIYLVLIGGILQLVSRWRSHFRSRIGDAQ